MSWCVIARHYRFKVVYEATLTIVNRLGLHARAAGKLVNLAKTFSSEVSLARQHEEIEQVEQVEQVDGKSIMAVMLLAAPVGSRIQLRVEGADADEAFTAITELINNGFGETD
jgi:phosphocarrier protein HPr